MWCISFHEQVKILALVKPANISPHFVHEHLILERCLHVYGRVRGSGFCRTCSARDCFLNCATAGSRVGLWGSMCIEWEKPSLNQHVKHINLTLSPYCPFMSLI